MRSNFTLSPTEPLVPAYLCLFDYFLLRYYTIGMMDWRGVSGYLFITRPVRYIGCGNLGDWP